MKKSLIFLFLIFVGATYLTAQTTEITAEKLASFIVPGTTDTTAPYYGYLGVRRVIVADPDNDGQQEIIATDYTNGGRVHVFKVVQDSVLEIVWSSPVSANSSGSTPRFPQVGDCDGDGKQEIIFEQRNYDNGDDKPGRIVLYEFNGTDWGTSPSLVITPTLVEQIGGREGLRFHREVLTVYDFDGDGKSEIIPHGNSPRKDVLILGVNGDIGGFPAVYIEGGKPGEQINGGDWGIGNSFYNSIPADIDGDGKIEIINHVWDKYCFWSIDVNGKDSYTYPEATDYEDAKAKGAVNQFSETDDVSYFGVIAADVNGDGRDEVVGSQVTSGVWAYHRIVMNTFSELDTGVYVWNNDSAYVKDHYNIIVPNKDVADLADKKSVGLWPVVKGDLNKDGKDELYTGGGSGLNLVAIQYNSGELLDPTSYDLNIVDDGPDLKVYDRYDIYIGQPTFTYDTTYSTSGDSIVSIDTTLAAFDESIIDTVTGDQPFTSYIFADSVDLDGDGDLEVVIAEQSVSDSIEYNFYVWDSVTAKHKIDKSQTYKVFNNYRQTIRVLEYTGVTGFKESLYSIVTPDDYKLEQNYPNPFNPSTTIDFALPVDKKISLKIYNMLGQEVKTLVSSKVMKKGSYQVVWNGTNNSGVKVASGNYIAKLEFGNFAKSIKMSLLK